MNGKTLQQVDSAKYLGITIHNTLGFASHITEVTSKANKKLGFLKRNLKGAPESVRMMAYSSLVRSGLEYGASIWDPYTDSQTKEIERIQNRAIRWIKGIRPRQPCSISQLKQELNIQTLEERRVQQRLTLFYKIVYGKVVVTTEDLGLEKADVRTRSKHGHKFREKRARSNRLKYSPVFRTVSAWNNLPAQVAEAGSVNIFKSQLIKHYP